MRKRQQRRTGKGEIEKGYSYILKAGLQQHLEVIISPSKYRTRIDMKLWLDWSKLGSNVYTKTYFNWNLVMPRKLARKIAAWHINRQSMKVAGIKLIEKESDFE